MGAAGSGAKLETSTIERVLEGDDLTAHFQPIVDLGRSGPAVHALECLTRGPRGTPLESAGELFRLARRLGAAATLDLACIGNALQSAGEVPADILLTLNVHASTLAQQEDFAEQLQDIAQQHAIPASRLIVEIIEYSPLHGGPSIAGAVDALRRIGTRIAVDDLGAGSSNYLRLIDCHPDYFKVDRQLISGCQSDRYRRIVLTSICDLARKTRARVVAEGVEHTAELATVTDLGIELIQGHLITPAKPIAELREQGILSASAVAFLLGTSPTAKQHPLSSVPAHLHHTGTALEASLSGSSGEGNA